jgi:hypothetical protein
MSRVYVTQEAKFNFQDAERYGEVVFMTHDDLWGIRNSAHNEIVMCDLARMVTQFDPREDWIVIAGSPYIAAAVFLQLGNKGVREVKVLRWDRISSQYQPMFIQLRREI